MANCVTVSHKIGIMCTNTFSSSDVCIITVTYYKEFNAHSNQLFQMNNFLSHLHLIKQFFILKICCSYSTCMIIHPFPIAFVEFFSTSSTLLEKTRERREIIPDIQHRC